MMPAAETFYIPDPNPFPKHVRDLSAPAEGYSVSPVFFARSACCASRTLRARCSAAGANSFAAGGGAVWPPISSASPALGVSLHSGG